MIIDFADWLDAEAKRLKDDRERLHGGTRRRMDLVTWADALQWAARKARERALRSQRANVVEHEPEWQPAELPINAAGQTLPGYICVHELENGNGQCGGNIFAPEQAVGKHRCIVNVGDAQ